MILLDTNVVSEPLRRAPEARVIELIDAQPLESLFLSAITVAELRSAMALLPVGKRRSGLQENLGKRVAIVQALEPTGLFMLATA